MHHLSSHVYSPALPSFKTTMEKNKLWLGQDVLFFCGTMSFRTVMLSRSKAFNLTTGLSLVIKDIKEQKMYVEMDEKYRNMYYMTPSE